MARKRRMGAGKAQWRTPLFVAASLALHAAVLGPLALGRLGIEVAPGWDGPHPLWPDPIDVVLVRRPALAGEAPRGRATPTAKGPPVSAPVTEIGPSEGDAPVRSGPIDPTGIPPPPSSPQPQASGQSLSEGPIEGIADPWRVQPGPGITASGPGPVRLDCRRAELLPPIEREVCAARLAAAATTRLGQRRLTRTESVRERGFAEQAAANEAWAGYRRSEDDGQSYPGLRSMLKHF